MIDTALENKIILLLESIDLSLYDIEITKENNETILRIYIFNPNGIDLDHCTNAHNLISPLLDVELEDFKDYTLEISSPGIERALKKERHFLLSKGSEVKVKLKDKNILLGTLGEFSDNTFILISKNEPMTINLNDCRQVKTIFDW